MYKTDYSDFKFRRLTGISRGGVTVMEWDETVLETKGLEYEFKYLYEMPHEHNLTFTLFGDFVENKSKESYLLPVIIYQTYLTKNMVSVLITNTVN